MAFLQVNAYSNVLGMEVCLDVILPQQTQKAIGTNSRGAKEDVPVLYLLHGMGGNHSAWQRRTSIERYVADLGVAVIMPSTDLAWYTDTTYDMNYWTFISEELPDICHELFPQLTQKREKTFAAGLSMGGYGALKLGLCKPDKFAAIASLSGAVVLDMERLLEVRKAAYWEGIFGPRELMAESENNPLTWLKTADKEHSPRIYLACGEEDFLYPANCYMAERLAEKDLVYTFEHGPGVHDWIFWDQWIQRALAWLFAPLARESVTD